MGRNSKSDSASVEDFKVPAYKVPVMTHQRRNEINSAAAAHASVHPNRSDPFSYHRIVTHMRRGLETPSDVLADARARMSPWQRLEESGTRG
jgi:hypothetical protein